MGPQVCEERWFRRRRKRQQQIPEALYRRREDVGLPIDAKTDHYAQLPLLDGSFVV
jgi:hypothetical protein